MPSGDFTLTVQPERLRLADGMPAMAEAANDGRFAWREGETVTAWFHPDDSWLIAEAPG